ncbi:MAG: ATP-binding cassette domain-containing protein [Helicobacteraceae bacterium]|jgi:putative ABC transport system ATP-binding protein|nr:ATP-binding cassette domain-containing protein [Helicobacteraceae bacterium]
MIALTKATVSFDNQIVLRVKSLTIAKGAKIAIVGESGSGKSTLLNVLCALERTSCGELRWNETVVSRMGELERDRFRGEKVGLVMQDFYLYSGLNALENVLLPSAFRSWLVDDRTKNRARYLLDRLGVKANRRVETLSRGEKQRTAIARALLRKPEAIIADEPTASLDSQSADEAVKALLDLADEIGCAIVCASHDKALIAKMDHRLKLKKGEMIEADFRC